ncbi:MAG: hypothetical protein NTZ70_05810 [Methylococcales bacterium]|nr:hypothetical protein [Methylococcales bacterium]
MKRFLFLCLLNTPIFAAEQTVPLTAEHIENLGIVQGKLTRIPKSPFYLRPPMFSFHRITTTLSVRHNQELLTSLTPRSVMK